LIISGCLKNLLEDIMERKKITKAGYYIARKIEKDYYPVILWITGKSPFLACETVYDLVNGTVEKSNKDPRDCYEMIARIDALDKFLNL
jgi:hypothetical protein